MSCSDNGPFHTCLACGKVLSSSEKLSERDEAEPEADYGEAWEDICWDCKRKTWESYKLESYDWSGLWNGLEEKGKAY